MSEIVDPRKRLTEIKQLLLQSEKQIVRALPRHLDPARMFRVYLTAVQTTPALFECTNLSIIGAVMQAAQLGLSLDPRFVEAFLIPRRNKYQQNVKVAAFQTGYKGLRKLALNGDPNLRDIYARVVHERDIFEFTYEPEKLVHSPALDAKPGALRVAYAKAVWKDGYTRVLLATPAIIAKARESSDAARKEGSPWDVHPDMMWAKTALRRLCESLTLSTESPLAKAFHFEDSDKGGEDGVTLEPTETNGGGTVAANPLDRVADEAAPTAGKGKKGAAPAAAPAAQGT
jgi:recombination protein RecT